MRPLALLLLLSAVGLAQATTPTGPWFDRTRNGHGLDLQRYGDVLVVGFFTYGADGEPEWYTAQAVPVGDVFEAPLVRFRNAGTPERPDPRSRVVGSLRLRFGGDGGSPCAAGETRPGAARLADLDATLDGERIRWCVEPALPASTAPESAMDGTWWGGVGDGGWGLTTYFVVAPPARVAVATLYHYDAAGEPRWSIAQSDFGAFRVDARWVSNRGYCRSCPQQALQARDAGPLSLALSTPLPAVGTANRIDTAAAYPGAAGGTWHRNGRLERISDSSPPPRVVATREGVVTGTADADDTVAWRGLPYAAPPLGALRWRAPQAASPRDRVLEAREFGPGCPQQSTQGAFGSAPPRLDEDCLSLNVWAPAAARAGDARPVMVWIHGGGHVQGGSSEQLQGRTIYDGSRLARHGVVLVSINYRLGALGYAAFREFIGEHPDQPQAGNYGLLDQVAALRWVRDNIARFGGDPARVTIFGESAGGVSVCALLAAPAARGLFARAITQSGPCDAGSRFLLAGAGTLEPAVAQGERIRQRLACGGVGAAVRACLRAKPVAEVLAAAQGAIAFTGSGETYDEVVDGFVLDRSPGTALADGSAAPVPLMVGVNEDEATTLVPVAQRPQTAAAYEALLRASLPTIAGAVLAQYPAANYQPVWRAWTAINSDIAFICPAARAARDHAAAGRPVFAYYFTQSLPSLPELGAFHALEIAFLFSDLDDQPPALRALGAAMQRLWVDFATDGVPDAPGVPAWPRHPPASQSGLELNAATIAPRAGYRDAFCNFWARYLRL